MNGNPPSEEPLFEAYRRVRAASSAKAKTMLLRSRVFDAIRWMRPSAELAILRYHAICGQEGYRYADPGICVSPEAFERHLAYLNDHYEVVSLPDAVRDMREGRRLPPNAVAITFDDGYADNLAAARTLQKYGMTGTFYITAGCLAGEQPFWPSEIRALVALVPGPLLTLTLNGRSIRIPCLAVAERTRAVAQLTKLFKSNPIPVRERLREQLRAAVGWGTLRSPMLTWSQLETMRDMGMTIGAHTMTHPNLPSAGLKDATEEIVGAKERLESKLGVDVTMFSYPNGGVERYYTRDLQRVVREAGYEAATTSLNGIAGSTSDPFALERVCVSARLQDLVFALEAERFICKPAQ